MLTQVQAEKEVETLAREEVSGSQLVLCAYVVGAWVVRVAYRGSSFVYGSSFVIALHQLHFRALYLG
jgi:hypothetical protein